VDQPFNIYQVDAAEARKITATPDVPHSHNFEELIIAVEGELEHFIDFKTIILDAPLVCFVTKGKVHRAIPHIKNGICKMWVLRFKSEFIPETTFQLYSYYHNHANIKMQNGDSFRRLETISEIMFNEMQQPVPEYAIIRHLLSSLFTMIEVERKKQQPEVTGLEKTKNITFKNFLKILEENFHRPEGVEYYAEKLFMSPRNLNLICQSILHQTVTETIEIRKLIEAKNLLLNTDKSISEIGFELGFNEKAYFTTVFKKKSGQTPTDFREDMRKLIS
jgi:AraC family transcriptional activator of pobA